MTVDGRVVVVGGFERDEVEERWIRQRPVVVGFEWQH